MKHQEDLSHLLPPKHTKENPTFELSVACDALTMNLFKDCWANHRFESLPMNNLDEEDCRYTNNYRKTEAPFMKVTDTDYSTREWAEHYFVCTFGNFRGNEFIAKKYLDYMSAYDSWDDSMTHDRWMSRKYGR